MDKSYVDRAYINDVISAIRAAVRAEIASMMRDGFLDETDQEWDKAASELAYAFDAISDQVDELRRHSHD